MTVSSLSSWGNFYMIVGSSAAALIGLQFVVLALVSEMSKRTTADSISAFGTPTVIHLGGALLLSALMAMPWPTLFSASVVLGLCGLAGLLYGAIVFRRARRQTVYKPVVEDWIWHTILPCTLYAVLLVSALFFRSTTLAPFGIGGVALGLLFIGIHNAWDTVTYVVITYRDETTNETPSK